MKTNMHMNANVHPSTHPSKPKIAILHPGTPNKAAHNHATCVDSQALSFKICRRPSITIIQNLLTAVYYHAKLVGVRALSCMQDLLTAVHYHARVLEFVSS